MKTLRSAAVLIAGTVAVILVLFLSVAVANPQKEVFPEAITPASVCPVAGCSSSEGCHAAGPYPALEEGQVMVCPSRTGCTSTECHAIDRVTDTSRNPVSVSLYLWIVGLTVFVAIAIALAKKTEVKP